MKLSEESGKGILHFCDFEKLPLFLMTILRNTYNAQAPQPHDPQLHIQCIPYRPSPTSSLSPNPFDHCIYLSPSEGKKEKQTTRMFISLTVHNFRKN